MCFWYVDSNLIIHEAFMGLYYCHDIKAGTIAASIVKDILIHFDIDLLRCRGQCYDGGRNMAGSSNGVKIDY